MKAEIGSTQFKADGSRYLTYTGDYLIELFPKPSESNKKLSTGKGMIHSKNQRSFIPGNL
ncbi:hypothetical protein BSCG_02424 [Bacteroides sp. 2_2_4]|nr:hypothetical protein BSCG_02424 [Bacteroides sp. 2_2_4]